MIKYNLKCMTNNCKSRQSFDGWFENSNAFEKQKNQGYLTCPYCGSSDVSKNLMSPSIKSSKNHTHNYIENGNDMSEPNYLSNLNSKKNKKDINYNDVITVLRTLKKEVQDKADYVGTNFVKEARSIKSGKAEKRPIYGKADTDKIEELRDEGIEVSTIPWIQDDH